MLELLAAGIIGGLVARGRPHVYECRTVYRAAKRDPNYGVARISGWVPPKRKGPFCQHEIDRCTLRCHKCGKTDREINTRREYES